MLFLTYRKLLTFFTHYEREKICYILKTASTKGSACLQLYELFQSMIVEARGFDDPMELAELIYGYKDKFLKTRLIKEQRGKILANQIKNALIMRDKEKEPPIIGKWVGNKLVFPDPIPTNEPSPPLTSNE